MKNKFNIELPFFCGLYESPLYGSDTDYYETRELAEYYNGDYARENHIKDLNIDPENDIEMDFQAFKDAITKAYAEEWHSLAPIIIKELTNPTMSSPRFYNYSTDKVFADVELEDNWLDVMKQFITDSGDWFIEQIERDFTSRDGFMSFMENNLEGWLKGLEDEDDRYISSTLGYMMLFEDEEVKDHLIEAVYDDVYVSEYYHLNEEGEKKLQDALDNRPVGWDMTNQTEIPFEDSTEDN